MPRTPPGQGNGLTVLRQERHGPDERVDGAFTAGVPDRGAAYAPDRSDLEKENRHGCGTRASVRLIHRRFDSRFAVGPMLLGRVTHMMPEARQRGYEVVVIDDATATGRQRAKAWVRRGLLGVLGLLLLIAFLTFAPRALSSAAHALEHSACAADKLLGFRHSD